MTVEVPRPLRLWFVAHFLGCVGLATPLFIAPDWTLGLMGWEEVDTLITRLFAAALLGLGVESFVGRHAPLASYQTMLRIKIVWSVAASVGVTISLLGGSPGWGGWAVLGLFVFLSVLWSVWKLRLNRMQAHALASMG